MKNIFRIVLFLSLTGCSGASKENLEDIESVQSNSSYRADSTITTKKNYDSSLTKSSSSIDDLVSFSTSSTIENSSSASIFYTNEDNTENLTSNSFP